ncbi:MAG: AEC family transporter [Clostridia bacterium]|nr:AEC family transporter [Clostridia bacterium]
MNINIADLIPTSLCLFLLILVGFVARKAKIIDADLTKGLSTVVVKVAQPFLIIYSITKLDFSALNLKNGLLVLGFGILSHALTIALAFILFSRIKDIDEKKIYQFAFTFCNCAFIGFPILNSLFGEIGLFYGAFYVISYNLGVWSFGVWLMSRGKAESGVTVRKIFINAGTVPCFIGLALYIVQIPLPDFLMTAMDTMGSLCTPLSLIVTGSLVAALPLREFFLNPKFYGFLAVKLVALPLLLAVILRFTGISALIADIDLAVFLTVMVALPPAAFTTLLATLYDVKPSYSAQLISLGTILSPFTILLVMKVVEFIL